MQKKPKAALLEKNCRNTLRSSNHIIIHHIILVLVAEIIAGIVIAVAYTVVSVV